MADLFTLCVVNMESSLHVPDGCAGAGLSRPCQHSPCMQPAAVSGGRLHAGAIGLFIPTLADALIPAAG